MKSIRFIVAGEPIPQPRHKISIKKSNKTGKRTRRAYLKDGGRSQAFKQAIKYAARMAGAKPIDKPVRVELLFIFSRIQSQLWKRKPMVRLWHGKKPDSDNVTKAVLDALNGEAWLDDGQVCELLVRKVIAAGGEEPRIIAKITYLEPEENLSGGFVWLDQPKAEND